MSWPGNRLRDHCQSDAYMIVSDLSISVVDPSEVWTSLKGVCHEIFDLHFFHDLNPSRPLMNRLKYFRILFQFRQDIRSQS